jgi:hypothetical protein
VPAYYLQQSGALINTGYCAQLSVALSNANYDLQLTVALTQAEYYLKLSETLLTIYNCKQQQPVSGYYLYQLSEQQTLFGCGRAGFVEAVVL